MSRVASTTFRFSLDGSGPARARVARRPSGTPYQAARMVLPHPHLPEMQGNQAEAQASTTRSPATGPGHRRRIMAATSSAPARPMDRREWEGWWGDDPPSYPRVHSHPHPRPTIGRGRDDVPLHRRQPARPGGSQEAAGGLDVRNGGGPSTIRQFLAADLIDHMHVAIVPVVLGRGKPVGRTRELEHHFSIGRSARRRRCPSDVHRDRPSPGRAAAHAASAAAPPLNTGCSVRCLRLEDDHDHRRAGTARRVSGAAQARTGLQKFGDRPSEAAHERHPERPLGC